MIQACTLQWTEISQDFPRIKIKARTQAPHCSYKINHIDEQLYFSSQREL